LKLPRISLQTTRNLELLKQHLGREIETLEGQSPTDLHWRPEATDKPTKRPYQAPQVTKFRRLEEMPLGLQQVASELIKDLAHIETIVDEERRWVSVTESFARLLGYRRMDLIGQKIDDLTVKGSVNIEFAFEALSRLGEMDGMWMFRRRDGHNVLVHYHARLASGLRHAELTPLLVA
jgi:PAS domain S-box-containing protein